MLEIELKMDAEKSKLDLGSWCSAIELHPLKQL